MDALQIKLVQDSFVNVLPIPNEAAAGFYQRLFATAPETRAMFKGDMALQGRKLVMTLASIVDGLDQLDEIVPVARELAIRHVRYGVVPSQYALVGAALIHTLRDLLGSSFTPATEAAWSDAYALLSDVMIDAAYARR